MARPGNAGDSAGNRLPVGDAAIRIVEVFSAKLFGVSGHPGYFLLIDLDPEARNGWQLDVAVDHPPGGSSDVGEPIRTYRFLNQEVQYRRVHVNARGQSNGSDRAMRHRVDVVHLGHVRDTLELADTARVGAVRLDVRTGLLLEDLTEFPSAQETLAGRDRKRHVIRNQLQCVDVFLGNRFLDEHRANACQLMTDFDRESRRHLTVEVEAQLCVGADPFAHQLSRAYEFVDPRWWLVRTPFAARSRLERGIATRLLQVVQSLPRSRQSLVGSIADSPVGIDPHAVSGWAAEQLVDRRVVEFPRDIPERLIDAG